MLPALLITDTATRGLGTAMLRVALGGIGGAAAVATLLGFFGGNWWALDVLANFRVQYLVVLVVAGALYATLVGRVVGLLLLAAAAVNAVVVAPLVIDSPRPSAPGEELTVISFNVQASNRDRGPVVDWLAQQQADVVFLLESTFEWENSVAAADLPYRIVAEVPDRYTFGITVLARQGIEVTARNLVFADRPVVEATVPFGDRTMEVLGIHPLSPTSAERARDRDRHLDAAALWARARSGPVAVVGDLNASPWSVAFRRLVTEGDLDNSQAGFGLQPSWPDGWGPLMIPIDHALHSDDIVAVDRSTGPALGSDHRPVIVTFALAQR
jgi:endonuclease/exonuclease/phosphatase (EEP) superfamily protein YafD